MQFSSGLSFLLLSFLTKPSPLRSYVYDLDSCRNDRMYQNNARFKIKVPVEAEEVVQDVPCTWIENGKTLDEILIRKQEYCDSKTRKSRIIYNQCRQSCGKCCVQMTNDPEECYREQVCTELMSRPLEWEEEVDAAEAGIISEEEESSKLIELSIFYESTIDLLQEDFVEGSNGNLTMDIVNELNNVYKAGLVGCNYGNSQTQSQLLEEKGIVGVTFDEDNVKLIESESLTRRADTSFIICDEDSCNIKLNGEVIILMKKDFVGNESIETKKNIISTIQEYFDSLQDVFISKFDEMRNVELMYMSALDFECEKIDDILDVRDVDIRAVFEGENDLNQRESLIVMNTNLCPERRRNRSLEREELSLDIAAVDLQSFEKLDATCNESSCSYVSNGKVYFTGKSTNNALLMEKTNTMLISATPNGLEFVNAALIQSLGPEQTLGGIDEQEPEYERIGSRNQISAGLLYSLVGFIFVAVQVGLFVAFHKRILGRKETKVDNDRELDDMSNNEFRFIVRPDDDGEVDNPIDTSKMMNKRVGISESFASFPVKTLNYYSDSDHHYELDVECVAQQGNEEGSDMFQTNIYHGSSHVDTIFMG